MTICLVTDYFYPTSNGGTEKYIYILAKTLQKAHEVIILSINSTLISESFDGLNIDYILPNQDNCSTVVRGLRAPTNIAQFEEYLTTKKPDIVHFHTLTTNINQYHFISCKNKDIKTIFTSHIPAHICLRGDLLYRGETPCEGKISSLKCGLCLAHQKSSNNIDFIVRFFYNTLHIKSPIKLRLRQWRQIEHNTDKIVAVCNWQKEALQKNGINDYKIEICRQATNRKVVHRKTPSQTINFGFVGRIDPLKGLHLIVNSLITLNQQNVNLKIAAIPPSKQDEDYANNLLDKIKTLKNCSLNFNLNSEELSNFFSDIDCLIIPSLCYETGPFVAYEALAQHVPILSTNFGGQKELVVEGVNGFLFEPNEDSLMNAMVSFANNPIKDIATNQIRSEEMIGIEMLDIYKKVIK